MIRTTTFRVAGLAVTALLVLSGCWLFEEDDNPELALWVIDGPELSHGSSYDLGSTEVGATKTVGFTIENDGGTTLYVNGISVGTGFAVTGNTSFEVGDRGGQVSFDVVFTPTSAGAWSTDLTIRSDLPGSPVFTVQLTATATDPVAPPTAEPLAPPAWIQGVWRDTLNYNIYTFSADNVVSTLMSTTTTDFHQFNVDYLDLEIFYRDTEVSATVYKIELWSGGGVSQTLSFTQVDADTLSYQVDATAAVDLDKDP